MLKDSVVLGLRNLRERKARSLLTAIGIILGIASIVGLISLGLGLQDAVTSQVAALGANSITVQAKGAGGAGGGPPGSNVVSPLTEDDLEATQRVRGLSVATGRLIKNLQVSLDDERSLAFVASLPENTEERRYVIDLTGYKIREGRQLVRGDSSSVVVGSRYADNPVLGEELRVGQSIIIQNKSFDIVGILERRGSFQVDNAFLMNEDPLRDLTETEATYDVIIGELSTENIDVVRRNIAAELRDTRNVDVGEEDFEIQTQEEVLSSITSILSAISVVLSGIAAISLILGGISVANTMFTAVLERTREIGIMKSIGASPNNILVIFLTEAGLLGLFGGIIGITLGYVFGQAAAFVGSAALGSDLLRAIFPPYLVLGALAFSVVLGLLSGFFPARRAAKKEPVEALRS